MATAARRHARRARASRAGSDGQRRRVLRRHPGRSSTPRRATTTSRCSFATAAAALTRDGAAGPARAARVDRGAYGRHRGLATMRTDPGEGTEVELQLARHERGGSPTGRDRRRPRLFRAGVRGRARGTGRGRRGGRHGRGRRSPSIVERRPDVVLLDVHMPDGGGQAVIDAASAPRPASASSRSRSPTRPRT